MPSIYLHDALVEVGDSLGAIAIRDFLERHAIWARDRLYANWDDNTCGTYSDNGTSYFPYTVKINWERNYKWTGTNFADGPDSVMFSSLFAFMYQQTGLTSWMDLARSIFKDYYFYGNGGQLTEVKTTGPITAFPLAPASAWAKIGGDYTKTLYYLTIESSLQATPKFYINNMKLIK